MERIRILTTLFILINLCGCYRIGDRFVTDRDISAYEEIKSMYPDTLIRHLPDIEKGAFRGYHLTTPQKGLVSLIGVTMAYDKKSAKVIEEYARVHAVGVYRFTDKCLMIVNGEDLEYSKSHRSFSDIQDCSGNLLPIPNFDFVYNNTFLNRFYKNATIYVLGADSVKLFEEDKLTKIRPAGLPEKWRHGYSRGIAIYDNIVAYWLQSW